MSSIPSWMPDMSRNKALAGKTVSSKGMNVTYDEDGYAVQATNFKHKLFTGTKEGVRAPSIEAVLGGAERSKYTGTAEDLAHFSNYDLEHVEQWRQQVAAGEITSQQAYAYLEQLRSTYGYSCGPNNNEFVQLEYTKQPGQVIAEEKAAQEAQAVLAAQETSDPAAAQSPQSAGAGQTAQTTAPVAAASVQNAAPMQSETVRMQNSYQEELRRQQEQQTLKSELNDLRVDAMLKSIGEQKKDELFDILFEDEEKEEQNGL